MNDAATKWLQEAKLKLIAQKQAEREREMVDYKAASAGKVGRRRGGRDGGKGEGSCDWVWLAELSG